MATAISSGKPFAQAENGKGGEPLWIQTPRGWENFGVEIRLWFGHCARMAKVNANDVRPGQAIKWNNDTCLVLSREHRKPGKGPAYIQAGMRSLTTGRSFEERFRSSESLELVNVSREQWAFSYEDQEGFHFMNLETYESLPLAKEIVGETRNYLTPDLECDLMMIEGRVVSVDPPPSVNLTVTESPEGLKGDTASAATKPAKLETGIEIQVPLFIKEGEKITIDTRTNKYTGRA